MKMKDKQRTTTFTNRRKVLDFFLSLVDNYSFLAVES